MLRTLLLLGLPALLAAQSQVITPSTSERAQASRILPFQAKGQLKVLQRVGHVKVVAWDRADLEVRADFKPGGDGQHMSLKVEGGPDRMVLTCTAPPSRRWGWRFWRSQSASCDLELRVPRDIAAALTADVGNLSVEGVRGKVDLATDVGNIQASGLDGQGQGLRARTDVGSITFDLRGVKGSLRARTDVGSIRVDTDGRQISSQGRGHVEAALQGGGQAIELTTDVGSIHVK